jgi:hypothetical protein
MRLARCMCPSGPYVWPPKVPLHHWLFSNLTMYSGLAQSLQRAYITFQEHRVSHIRKFSGTVWTIKLISLGLFGISNKMIAYCLGI